MTCPVAHWCGGGYVTEVRTDRWTENAADGSTTAPSTDATEAVTGGIKAAAGLDQGSTIPAASKNERQAHSAAATQQQKKLLQVLHHSYPLV